jgi:shikimate dehydrogenase
MITGATKVLAVFGNPVRHSLSPQMHAGWIADHGLDATYVALPLDGDAGSTFRALKHVGLHGANVTVPFKEAAAAAADVRSDDVQRLGVANTLHWKDGAIHAHNTDWSGARDALDEARPDWAQTARTVLVVGAGGAARAMAWGLAGDDRRLLVVNRSRDKAEALAAFLRTQGPAEALAWDELAAGFAAADVIVNATTLGMQGAADTAWPVAAARGHAIVHDAVYAPLETSLLRAARARGLATVDGLGMLIHQGARAFGIWFGIQPSAAKARERLLAALKARA